MIVGNGKLLQLLLLITSVLSSVSETMKQSGLRSNRVLEKQDIVGGSVAVQGRWPTFAAFVPNFCGGTLIAPNRVLTAAHCVQDGNPNAVRIGAHNLTDGELIDVVCSVTHPLFKKASDGETYSDLAVLKLAKSAKATPSAINDDPYYPSVSGTPLTVIGFGATSEGGSESNVLKQVETYFVTISNCSDNYNVVEGTNLCANAGNQGDCQGDSGGPMFDSNDTQVGIVNYGIGCARPSEDVYANVGGYYHWIQDVIASDDTSCSTIPANANDVGGTVSPNNSVLGNFCRCFRSLFRGLLGFIGGN